MKRFLVAAVLCSSLAAAADPSRARVLELLGGFERTASDDQLISLGPGADRALIALAQDRSSSRFTRRRALAALGALRSIATRDFLRARLRELAGSTEMADRLDLATCVRALARIGDDALTDLVPLLAHAHPFVRLTVVEALAGRVDARVEELLAQRSAIEEDATVRDAIARAIGAGR